MPDPKRPLSDGKIAALKLLKQARDDAEDAGCDRWQFAVRLEDLLATGVTVNDLRWLVLCRLIEGRLEITAQRDRLRVFRATINLSLQKGDCFVLSDAGRVYVETRIKGFAAHAPVGNGQDTPEQRMSRRYDARKSPHALVAIDRLLNADASRFDWRPSEGELRFCGEIVWRRGRKIARFEELLLARFANAEDKDVIANPFGESPEARRRLKEAVRRLNNRLLGSELRFHVMHNGAAASWDEAEPHSL